MLILKLMSRCNCSCVFCCVREELARGRDIPIETLKARICSRSPDTTIDFFGGEPTLYPHFLEALTYARERGHPCRIASNATTFSNKDFTKRVAELGVEQIRTSLYGHTAALHDRHTSKKNSFHQTLTGINNIVAHGIDLFVNTVVTTLNAPYLPDIVDLLHNHSVRNTKFGSLINAAHCLDLVPDPDIVRCSLDKALSKASVYGMAYACEKTAICVAPNYASVCAYEPNPYIFCKSSTCESCSANEYCVGFPKETIGLYGKRVFHPIKSTSLNQHSEISEVLIGQQHEFVSWEDNLEKSITIICKASAACNLACDYCYAARNFGKPSVMSLDTVETLMEQLASTQYMRVDFNWHGGEPLLAKPNFYCRAVELQNQHLPENSTREITHRLQTNATLLSERWIDDFRNLQFELGLSLDGPQHIHDKHRVYTNGTGTFGDIINSVRRLAKKGLSAEFLCVVTTDSYNYVDEIFDFFSALSVTYPNTIKSLNFMPAFEVNLDNGKLHPSSVQPDEFAGFMIALFNRWFNEDNNELDIVFFEQVITVLLGGHSTACHLNRGCRGFLTMEPSGDIYPCDRFSGLPDFRFGNINTNKLEDILASPNRQNFNAAVTNYPKDCLGCHWLRACHGGCLYESYALTQRLDQPTFYCTGLKKIYQHIDEIIKEHMPGYRRYAGGETLLS